MQIITSTSALSNPTPASSLDLWQITCYNLPYLRWSTLHHHPLSPCSLLYPRPQLQQALLRNPQASPAREAYRLTTDTHLSLSSSKTNPPVLSPALEQNTRCGLFCPFPSPVNTIVLPFLASLFIFIAISQPPTPAGTGVGIFFYPTIKLPNHDTETY